MLNGAEDIDHWLIILAEIHNIVLAGVQKPKCSAVMKAARRSE
jgi:hypothetical protein